MAYCPTKPELILDEGVWKVMKDQNVIIIDPFTSNGFKMLIGHGVKDHSFSRGEDTLVMWFESIKEPENLDKLRNLIIETRDCPLSEVNVFVSPLLYLLIISSSNGGSKNYSESIIWLIDHFKLMLPPGWEQFQDQASLRFYYQPPPGVVTWERPTTCYPELYFIAGMINLGINDFANIGSFHLSSFIMILIMLLSCDADLLQEYSESSGIKKCVLQDVYQAIHNFYKKDEYNSSMATYFSQQYIHHKRFFIILDKIFKLYNKDNMRSIGHRSFEITPENYRQASEIYRLAKVTLKEIKDQEDSEEKILKQRKADDEILQQEVAPANQFRIDKHEKPVVTVNEQAKQILKAQYEQVVIACRQKSQEVGTFNLLDQLNRIYPGGGIAHVETFDRNNEYLYRMQEIMCREQTSGTYRYVFLINQSNSDLTSRQNKPIMLLPPPRLGMEGELLDILGRFQFFSDHRVTLRTPEYDKYYKPYFYYPNPTNRFYIFLYKCKSPN
jgi:hypothetical protein